MKGSAGHARACTCSELLEEPHAGAEELVGTAEVAQVGPTQGQEEPQGRQVGLQDRLCQSSSDDQVPCTHHICLNRPTHKLL